MSTPTQATPTITPARLGFLSIYNPSLGPTDATIDDQIVYYASINGLSKGRRRRHAGTSTGGNGRGGLDGDQRNERLRQIGLAQGMVEFGRSFSGGRAVNVVETVGSRVVVHELEPGWWILASIDLTRLPISPPTAKGTTAGTAGTGPAEVEYEYSSREVKPAALLLQDLLRAHSVFLLHHASSLSALFVRTQRDKFVSVLGHYWDLFLSTWDVLLHGNPACNVFGGIKIAACGELGIGVGEEERGSGERDVLEGLVGRFEGLVDLVVGKFEDDEGQWLGTGREPGAEDGVIFLGVGALSRQSLKAITYWMEDMFTWGDNAYGVMDRPAPTKKKTRARKSKDQSVGSQGKDGDANPDPKQAVDENGMDKIFSYLKLGYGTSWSLGSAPVGPTQDGSKTEAAVPKDSAGRFLIGLIGDIEKTGSDESSPDSGENSRTIVRTLSVELESEGENRLEADITKDLGSQDRELTEQKVDTEGNITEANAFDSQDRNKTKKMRVVVYAAKPFIFVFLFQPRTDSLEWEGAYRSLHSQLTPICKPLINSTAYRPERPDVGSAAQIYDLVWDPRLLTAHSTIPNIPDPLLNPEGQVWTRVEALNTHNQILNMFMATRENLSEYERTCKTSRGWWVVWNRILERPGSPSEREPEDQSEDETEASGDEELSMQDLVVSKEIFLIRRASDNVAGGKRSVSSSYVASGGWADGASRLAQGIGVDTRRYIEGLLSLNR